MEERRKGEKLLPGVLLFVLCSFCVSSYFFFPSGILGRGNAPVELLVTAEDHPDLFAEMMTSAAAQSAACSSFSNGRKKPTKSERHMSAWKCGSFWTDDATIYDLHPPHGVVRGRNELIERMTKSLGHRKAGRGLLELSTNYTRHFLVRRVGYVGHATALAWQTGLWKVMTPKDELLGIGRYSSIMRNEGGVWKHQILAVMEVASENDWIAVTDGSGGDMIPVVQDLMNSFTEGFNEENYHKAFEGYSKDALFPVMTHMGGDDIDFAVRALIKQREKMVPVQLQSRVDEVIFPVPGISSVCIAHGTVHMHDHPSALWLFGRFSFLLIVVKEEDKVNGGMVERGFYLGGNNNDFDGVLGNAKTTGDVANWLMNQKDDGFVNNNNNINNHNNNNAAQNSGNWKIEVDFSPNNWLEPLS